MPQDHPPSSPSDLISIGKAADALGVSIDTIRRWTRDGQINAYRSPGGHRLFSVSELKEFKNNKPLTISEAAAQLGVSPSTLRRYEQQGRLSPQRKLNGERLYTKEIINNFKAGKKPSDLPSSSPLRPILPEALQQPIVIDNSNKDSEKALAKAQTKSTNQPPHQEVPPLPPEMSTTSPLSPVIFSGEPIAEPFVKATSHDPLFIPTNNSQSQHQVRQVPFIFDPPSLAIATPSVRPRVGRLAAKALTIVLLAAVASLGILNIKSQITSTQRQELLLGEGSNNHIGIPYEEALLATLPSRDGRVLAISTEDLEQFFEINVPTIVNAPFQVNGAATITGVLELQGNVEGPGIDINLGSGRIFASNIVNSIQGQAGEINLVAGEGIVINGLTISNTAPGEDQDAFQVVAVGQDSVTADSPTDTITFAAGNNVSLTLDKGTKSLTIAAEDGLTYTAGTDLELSGTEFSVSSTLTGVTTINGLTTLDTTSEATVESTIFDTDAATITGAWNVDDNVDLAFGANSDWTFTYDETDRDQLLLRTTNTAANSTSTPLFEILVGTTPTPNQNVFAVSKGTPASNTDLFTIDEDGDTTITGAISLNGITYIFPPDQSAGNGALLATDGAGNLTWISAGAGGLADVTAVGDCVSGDCFNGSSGSTLTFNDGDGDGVLTIANLTGAQTWTLPNDSGTFVLSGHSLEDDVSATIGANGTTSVTVEAINGTPLGSTTATSGNLLIANGTQWQTVALSGSATINASGVLTVADNSIEEQMLAIDNAPSDEYCLTYESASGNFEWDACDSANTITSLAITDGAITETLQDGDQITFADSAQVNIAVSATDTVTATIIADSIDGTELADALTLDSGSLVIDDGTNTLLTLTDAGTTGNLNLTGDLTVGGLSTNGFVTVSSGTLSSQSTITLGTDTAGNYIDNVTAGNGISITGSVGEGWEPAVAINLLDSGDGSGLTTSNSGLEFAGASSNELGLIQGCSDQQLLKWNDATNSWFCASGSGTSAFDISDGSTSQTIQDSDTLLFSDGTSINLNVSATDTVTADVIDDSIDGTELADAITLDSGSLLFDDGTTNFFAIVDNGTQGEIRLYEESGSGSNYISLKTPATLASDVNLTLPPDDGESDYVLVTNGNGVLTWQDPTSVGAAGDIAAVGTCESGSCFVDGNTTDYQLIFEGTTDDAFEVTLAATDATSDTTITLPNLTGTIILSGHTFTDDVTGTLDASGTTVLTIAADSVALGTDTTGNYVAVVNTTGSLTGGSAGSEGASLTLDVADDSINGTELSDSFSVEDGTLLDFSAIVHNDSAAQGVKLPQSSSLTAISGGGEGYLAWDTDDDQLKVYDGSAWQDVATGISTAWNDIGDPDDDQTLNMAEFATLFDWNTAASSSAFDAFSYNITNDAGTDGGNQRLLVLTNADDAGATGTTEALLVIENQDTNEAVTTAITISAAAGGIATAIDLSDPEIVTALSVGANNIIGTTATINFTFFDVDASGNITTAGDLAVNGDDITADGALTINSSSYVRVGDSGTPGSANGDDDLFVEGDLEVNGITYLDGDTLFGSDTLLDLSAINHDDSTGQGLKLPQNSSLTALSGAGEGFLAWDTDDDQVKVFNGTSWVDIATGISTAWNDIGDPNANHTLNMAEFTTDFDWNTADTAAAVDAFTFSLTNDATTDSNSQRLLILENADAAGATATERLLVLNNLDTTEAVTTALEIISAAGTIGTAIDVSDAEITTALSIGANEIAGTTGTINFNNFDVDASGNITTAGDLTIQGDDLFLTTNTSGFILVADGTNYNPVDVSGDVDISNAGVVTIQANSVALGTDTTGDYVTSVSASGPLSASGTGESAVVSLSCPTCLTSAGGGTFALTLAGDSGSSQTINASDTISILTTGALGAVASATDTVTVSIDADGINGSDLADNLTLDAGLTLTYDDAATNSVTDILTLAHSSSGTPASGLGTGLSFHIEDAGGLEEQAAIDAVLTTVTDSAEVSDIVFSTQQSGSITEVGRFVGATDTFDVSGNLAVDGTTTFNALTYTWPGSQGADRVLSTDGSGNLTWQTVGGLGAGGDVTAVGNCTTDACFTGSSGHTLTFSTGEVLNASVDGTIAFTDGTNNLLTITDAGTTGDIASTGDLTVSGGLVTLGSTTQDGSVVIHNDGATDYTVTIQPHGTQTQDITYTLPPNDGDSDNVLSTDGAGNLVWASVSGVGAGDGDIKTVGSCTSGDCFVDGTNHNLTFEGSITDGFEIILQAADATSSDKTITLPDAAGTILLSGHTFTGDVTATLDTDGSTALSIGADVVDGTELADNITLDAGLVLTQDASGESITFNYTDTGSAQTDAFVITGAASTTITDAIDVSDAEITNAINIGANNIVTSGGTITSTELDVLTSGIVLGTETSGDFVGTITAGAGLTSTGATTGEDIDHTLTFDCSEVEGTDIDCSGEAITLETTLDSVTTINGLTTLDATSEDTVEGAIFDADAQNISGVWEVQDDTNFAFGNDANWTLEYDETTDDQLLLTTTNTGAAATTDPLLEILVPTTPTADQQLFGIAKGSQGTNTPLFTVDEDGDLTTAGTTTFNGVTYTWPGSIGANDYVLTAQTDGTLAWVNSAATADIITVGDCTGDACFTEDGTASNALYFEGSTANGFETLLTATDPTGDNTITLPNASGIVILSGHTFSGDVTATLDTDGGTALTIAADSVALGTDTTGNYVTSVNTTGSLTGGSAGSEGAALTLDVADDSIEGTELADAITLDAATLVFDDGTNTLLTLTDAGTTGNLSITGALTVPGTTTINGVTYTWPAADAAGSGYVLSSDGAGTLSWTDIAASVGDISAVGDCTTGTCFTADGTASNNLYFEGATANGFEVILTAADATSSDKTITLPDRTGTVILSGDTFTGDVTATLDTDGSTALTIAADSVALGTDTTGNYVATLADAGSGDLTITNGSTEGGAATIDIADDSLDFTELEDTLDLDAALTLNQGTNAWSQDFAGTTTTGFTYTADDLTTGRAFQINATNTAATDTAVEQILLSLTNAQATNANTNFAGLSVDFTNNPTVAGNTEYAARIQNQVTTNTTDNAVAALLYLDNADTSAAGSTVVTDGLLIAVSGTLSGGIIDAIDASDSNITNALNIGANDIVGTTGAINLTNFDVDASGHITGVNLTNTGVVDFGAATSLAIPTGTAPTVNSNGEIALDTSVTDFSHGIIKYYSGEELGLVGLPIGQFTSPTDGYLIAYNATNDEFELVADDSGGSMSSFTLAGDTGTPETVEDGETVTIATDGNLTATVGATNTVTVSVDADAIDTVELADTLTLGSENLDINLDSTGEFAIQDGGADVFHVADDTGVITISEDLDLALEAAENLSLTKSAASTVDLVSISDGGNGTTTSGVDALSLDFTQGTDGASDTNAGLNIAVTGSGESGDTLYGANITTAGIAAGTLYGANIAGITAGSGTEYGLVIGTGWDKGLYVQSVSEFTAAVTYSGDGRPTRQITLSPEYEGASLSGDGSSNVGTMTSDFCAATTGVGDVPSINTGVCNSSGDLHSYYSWTTAEGTAQDYDIYIRYRVPDNFSAWASNPIDVFAKRTDATNNAVTVFVYDTTGTLENASGTQVAGTSWTSTTVESSFAGTYTAGSYMTIRMRMTADTGGDSVQVGEINLDYLTNN